MALRWHAVVAALVVASIGFCAPVFAGSVQDDFVAAAQAQARGDHAGAASIWRQLAEKGHAESQFNLGYCYYWGQGVPRDWEQAAHWFEMAAAQGLAQAQNYLGFLHQYGEGVPRDLDRAEDLYQAAAEQGLPEAQCNLGHLYRGTFDRYPDYDLAVAFYLKAANQGDGIAQSELGVMYWTGLGVPRDPVQAYKWQRVAVMSGSSLGKSRAAALAREMSPEQIAEAERLAKEWRPPSKR